MTLAEPNAGQIEFWNGDVGRRWALLQARIDETFSEVTAVAIEAAAPHEGERVIDIGCGGGGSVLALAQWVGSTGHVLGIDVSEVMLDAARARISARKVENVDLALSDASVHPFEPGAADLVFSRFGTMFFDNPVEAFANIRRALRPQGRLVFVCWRAFKDNPFFTVPLSAARPHLPAAEEPQPDPDAPGPFAFADESRVHAILARAGFASVAVEPAEVALPLAGAGAIDAARDFIVQIGPVAAAMATGDEAQRRAAGAAVRRALETYDAPDGVRFPARIWVVVARP